MPLSLAYELFLDTNTKRVIAGSNTTSAAPPLTILYSTAARVNVHMMRSLAGRLTYLEGEGLDPDIEGASLLLTSMDGSALYASQDSMVFFPTTEIYLANTQTGGDGQNAIHRLIIKNNPTSGYFAFQMPDGAGSDESEESDGSGRPRHTPPFDMLDFEAEDVQAALELMWGEGNIRCARVSQWEMDIEFVGELAETAQEDLMGLSHGEKEPTGLSFEMSFDDSYLEDVQDAPDRRVEALLTLRVTALPLSNVYDLFSLPVTLVATPPL